MLKQGAWILPLTALLILSTPRSGDAGIGEWIWEMSGPSMLGATSGCSLSLKKALHRCSIFGFPVPLRSPLAPPADTPEAAIETAPPGLGEVWLELDGGTYVSLWKNSGEGADEHDFRVGHTYMLTFDPMIGFKTKLGEHGVGITLDYILGNESYVDSLGTEHDFDNFGNWGFKLRPVVLRWHRMVWEWNIRLYPNGFDVVEGSDPAVVRKGDDFEVVNAIAVTLPF